MPKADSKRRIQEALLALLAERPLERITVTDICRVSGVSRTTYYRDYYSQADIVRDILDEFFSELDDVISMDSRGYPTESAMLRQVITYEALALYRRHASSLRVILESDQGPALRRRLHETTLRYLEPSGDAGKDGSIQGWLERRYCAAGMVEVMCDWVERGCDIPLDELTSFMLRMG